MRLLHLAVLGATAEVVSRPSDGPLREVGKPGTRVVEAAADRWVEPAVERCRVDSDCSTRMVAPGSYGTVVTRPNAKSSSRVIQWMLSAGAASKVNQ